MSDPVMRLRVIERFISLGTQFEIGDEIERDAEIGGDLVAAGLAEELAPVEPPKKPPVEPPKEPPAELPKEPPAEPPEKPEKAAGKKKG